LLARVLCCSLAIASGVHMCSSPRCARRIRRRRRAWWPAPGRCRRRPGACAWPLRPPRTRRCRRPGWGAAEVLLDEVLLQADGLEDLRAAVRHVGADAHLGHDLGQALADGLDVVVDRLLGRQVARQVLVQLGQGLHRQVGVHGLGAIAGQHGEVVHLARGAGFHHQAGGGAQALAHQVVVDGRQRQQRRDRDLVARGPRSLMIRMLCRPGSRPPPRRTARPAWPPRLRGPRPAGR
jgi:hypothetical protein